jgi:hypothetical protein
VRAAVVALVLLGCAPALDGVKHGQRVENAAGHSAAAYLIATCEVGYDMATTQAEIDRLDEAGCTSAAHALTELSEADAAIVALVDAYEAGQCVATIARDVGPKCDLLAAGEKLKAAAEAVDRAAEHVKARTK